MKRLFDGDRTGAMEMFRQCLETGQVNFFEFARARIELAALTKP
jgi:hypothetical protein